MRNAFIICRAKRRGNSSWNLEQALRDVGVESYRVTPHHTPARHLGWGTVFINYGSSATPDWWDRVPNVELQLNTPHTVARSANKTLMTQALSEANVPHLASTTHRAVAERWAVESPESVVVCRTMLRASRGRGIVLAHSDDEVVDAPLYTKLFTGHGVREYRVFIINGQAVDIVEKRRRGRAWCREHGVDRDSEVTNLIRSHHNGWVFARNTMEATPTERETICLAAESAADAISLGYGCVDMIVDRYANTGDLRRINAVETNTSPGIDRNATTTRKLAEGIAKTIGAL